ncbi:hypothetical protein BO71DRAFT_406415 [Aspergillus ellipticus CBS 707.79]|uniref:Uncharacterized protein n=1 Tax=Aspergillus ellipticus CBS 707.79 TaxID=1448320 RepID=A0A319DKP0_9EURO|nr:hypothetical protein BO71DRAFT_406415 [Aspergillus ellipticus CBS 707.79]
MGTIRSALAAAALFIAQGAATTATATATGNATTTYLSIFDSDATPSGDSWLEYLGGSVTHTIAPDNSSVSIDGYILATEYVYCNTTSSTQSARCYITETAWASIGPTTATLTTSVTSHLNSSYISYAGVPVTAGIEKLIATPSATATATSSVSPSATGSPASSSRSKAWIAGPVVGAAPDDGENPAGGLNTKAELPATNATKTGLATDGAKAELPNRVARMELPSEDATRAELASSEVPAAELPEMGREGVYELP